MVDRQGNVLKGNLTYQLYNTNVPETTQGMWYSHTIQHWHTKIAVQSLRISFNIFNLRTNS